MAWYNTHRPLCNVEVLNVTIIFQTFHMLASDKISLFSKNFETHFFHAQHIMSSLKPDLENSYLCTENDDCLFEC